MGAITYQDIARVNSELSFTDVKGKMYAEVPQRVKAFRILYPQGFISTEIISMDGGVAVMKATAGYYDDEGEMRILGTGLAYEKEGSSFINKTSYVENCETSAVGRALGFIGLGSESSIASAEEVVNAINNQGETKKPKQYKCDDSEPAEPVAEAPVAYSAPAAIKAFCAQQKISTNMFTSIYNALCEQERTKRIPSTKMTEDECNALLTLVKTELEKAS